jgi:hypothetical protein
VTSPFTVDTRSDALCELKEGIDKVVFTVDFDHNNPNIINYVKFSESYDDGPDKTLKRKHFVVTQTSVGHVHEDTMCPLWLEIPQSVLSEDISAVVNLWKVHLCCDRWTDFLPTNPVTQLEKSHRLVSEGNAAWLKTQLIQREGLLANKNAELAARNKDVEDLATQVCELSMQLAEVKQQLEESQSLSLVTPKNRKILTPSSRARKAPRTAPAKSFTTLPGGRSEPSLTPSKEPRFFLKDTRLDDPFC